MTMKEVYIADLQRPWRPIQRYWMEIVEGKKFVWADDGRRRYLLGGSAFFMEAGAKRRRKALLEQITGNSYCRNMLPGKWAMAMKALKEMTP